MTGNAFLKRLAFQLDFLNEEDQRTVISFYKRKLANAGTLLEEEAIVKSFGSPEHIAKKLKEAYLSHLAASESEEEIKPSEPEEKSDVTAVDEHSEEHKKNEEPLREVQNTNDDDLIFSKPQTLKKAPEVIHSLENKEVKTLYGEKVVIEERTEPIEEIILEPIDDENGLTEEEIRQAKEETLEKTNNFTTASIELPAEFLENESTKETSPEEAVEVPDPIEETVVEPEAEVTAVEESPFESVAAEEESSRDETEETVADDETVSSSVEKEACSSETVSEDELLTEEAEAEETAEENSDDEDSDPEEEEVVVSEKKPGVITRLFASSSMPRSLAVFLTVLVSVVVSPILLVVFGIGVVLYAVSAAFVILIALLAFALIALLIVLGVAELIYGFSSLFDSISVALIEIGIGTVVFAIVTALAALVYEFLFGFIPKVIRVLTKYFVRYLKKVSGFLYGGNA